MVNQLNCKELHRTDGHQSPQIRRDSIAPSVVPPVRILLDYRPALRERSGAGEYVHELARALAHSAPPDEQLYLFSSSWKDRLAVGDLHPAIGIDRKVPVRVLNFAWHRLGWPAAERIAGRAVDIAHSSHPLLMPARDAAQVITIHDLDFLDHPERTAREVRRDYPALAASHATRADHVIVPSRYTAQLVSERLGVESSRVSVCAPGAPERWSPRPDEPPDDCILFLGTLEPRKNVGALVDAYARLLARRPDAPPLVLAGRVTPALAPLVSRAGAPPLAGHVRLPGYVDPVAKEALYRTARVLVVPSHNEGFGIPVVEAMTVGVPVVAANRGALPEVAGDAAAYFDANDADALAALLEAIVFDRARRDRMRQAGWQHVTRYRWSATASQVREAWRRALHTRETRQLHRSARG